MGAGIAQLAAQSGARCLLADPDAQALERGLETARGRIERGVVKGRLRREDLGSLEGAADLSALAGAELVIEAAPEDLELKRELFAEVARHVAEDCVLATNTSSLSVTALAAGVPGPERVVGMHFFNPPPLMKLVEVVAAEGSSEEALAATTAVAEQMDRTPIRAKDSPGFVANRLARPFSLESLRMLGDGVADVATIDRGVRLGGGFRMGPFELLDLIGLDVNLEIARSFFAQGGEPERWRPSPIQEQLVAEGRFGRKSGRGYYDYDEERESDPDLGIDAPTLDPEQLAKIDPAAEQILSRLFAQTANEAAFALEEEVASPEDMETAMKLGFNWPLGPLGITELIGPQRAVEILDQLAAEHGEAYGTAPQLRAQAGDELA